MNDQQLFTAAKEVIERWDSPLWKDLPHTGEAINRLRQAVEINSQARENNYNAMFIAKDALYDIIEIDNSPNFICEKRAIKALEEIRLAERKS